MHNLKVAKLNAVLFFTSCLFLLMSCGDRPEAAPSVIKVGLLVDKATPGGEPSLRAARLVTEQINRKGGLILGGQPHQVVLFVRDTENNPTTSVEAARDLIHREGVAAIVGPNISRNAIPAAKIAQHAGIPLISPGSTNPETTRDKDFVFRTAFVDTYQGCIMARFAREDLGAETAAVLFDIANSSNRDVARVFQSVFSADGGRVIQFLSYATGETDYSEAMAQIAQSKPDVLFLPNYSRDLLIQAGQAREAGITAVLLGSDAWSPARITGVSELAGAYFNQHWHPDSGRDNPRAAAFLQAFRESFQTDPVNMAALTADAFGMLFNVISAQGKAEPSVIQQGLSGLQDYEGITGSISYDEDGDPQKGTVILNIREDEVVLHKIQRSICPVDLNL